MGAAENAPPLRLAAIGDVHAGRDDTEALRGLFREIAEKADVLALCGDLTNLGTRAEAEALAAALDRFGRPIVAVLGNHDHEGGDVAAVQEPLRAAGVKFLETETCTIGGVGFAGVKGFAGGFGSLMLSSFGEGEIKGFVQEAVAQALRLETALRSLPNRRRVVVLHYAPIAATVAEEPREIFPFLGSSRLAETIDRFGVTAVVHGHAHKGPFAGHTPGGVPVYNCAAPVAKEGGRPYALLTV
jgi:Icc-related predicted phosphoesterase